MNIKRKFVFLINSLTFFFLCLVIYNCNLINPNNESLHFPFYELNSPFILKLGECALLSNNSTSKLSDTIIICFDKVLKDGRCLKSDCPQCYGSTAEIQIKIIDKRDTSYISLTTPGCNFNSEPLCNDNYFYRKDTLGYRICLLRLEPYPDYNNIPIKLSDYTVKLDVIKL